MSQVESDGDDEETDLHPKIVTPSEEYFVNRFTGDFILLLINIITVGISQ